MATKKENNDSKRVKMDIDPNNNNLKCRMVLNKLKKIKQKELKKLEKLKRKESNLKREIIDERFIRITLKQKMFQRNQERFFQIEKLWNRRKIKRIEKN